MSTAPAPAAGRRRRSCGLIAGTGLAIAGLGFVLAGVQPGAGPRLVTNGSEIAGLYLPPVIAGAVLLFLSAVVLARPRAVGRGLSGGLVGVVLFVGSATFGLAGIVYRLGDPTDVLPFIADTTQLLGEILAVAGGVGIAFDAWRRPTSRPPATAR